MNFASNNFSVNGVSSGDNPELENQHISGINRMEPRSNLIPAHKKDVYYKNKEESVYLQSLNGDYKFAYMLCDKCKEFYTEDFDDSNWDTIDVPSMWQYRGYGKCEYPNVEYPIPFNPPYICRDNPVGYYRKKFQCNPDEKTILHFGGVDNAFYVYINGNFAGFSKGSRIPSEFDITPYIRRGENTIAVKVFSFSDGSYLENQDMLMANGIFRDVYLLHTKKVSLSDFRFISDEKGFDITIDLWEESSDFEVEISLDGKSSVFEAKKHIEARFDLENPKFWNDEEPNCYDLYITIKKDGIPSEIHSKKIGIISSEITGNKLLVN